MTLVALIAIFIIAIIIMTIAFFMLRDPPGKSHHHPHGSTNKNDDVAVAASKSVVASATLSVFSFSLYGQNPKYTMGMVENVRQIQEKFPGWQVWIYIADNVPADIKTLLQSYTNVKLIPVPVGNMIDRFLSIDDPSVGTMIVRDADSRIHDRDASVIREFVASDKLFHIVRDHPAHKQFKILGGMWGMKKGALSRDIGKLYKEFNSGKVDTDYGRDQDFLRDKVYPLVMPTIRMVHDPYHSYPNEVTTEFKVPLVNREFIGQVYENGRAIF